MNILVQGAGSLGAYFGGRIHEAGYPVSFLVREKRAEQIRNEGLKIYSSEGNYENKDVSLYTSPGEVRNIDLVILAVKGYHLDQVIPQLTTIVKQTGAFVLPLLNGVEQLERLDQVLGKEKVLGGFASIIATLNEQGHVMQGNTNSTVKFGVRHQSQLEICSQLEMINQYVKTNILREEDILKHMWKKYIFITAFSGITSAMNLPSGFIANTEASFNVGKNVVLEMSMLAEKEGISLTEQEVEKIINNLKGFSKDATSSMHQDLRKGLPIEIEHLHGGALRFAAKHRVDIPVIETLYGVLKPYENGRPY